MRLLLIFLIVMLCSCGSFLRSGSRGSLSEATEKSHKEDPAERKVGHDYDADPEYRPDIDHYTTSTHYDYRRDTLKSNPYAFDYSSVAGKPQFKSKTRDSLQTISKSEVPVDTVDSTLIVPLDGIDLGIDKKALKGSKSTEEKSVTTSVGHQAEPNHRVPSIDSQRELKKNKESVDHNFVFGIEADPQLLLSKNVSKAIGGTFFIGGAINNERTFGKKRHYFFGKVGYHQYRIGSDDDLLNEFKWNELNSFCMGLEYMRYYGAIDNPVAAPYFLANGSYEIVGWDYVYPLIDSVSNEEIHNDKLSSFSLASGSGVTFMNSSPVRLGLNVTAGFRVYGFSTFEEFDNNLFKPELFLKGAIKLWVDMGFRDNKKGPLRK